MSSARAGANLIAALFARLASLPHVRTRVGISYDDAKGPVFRFDQVVVHVFISDYGDCLLRISNLENEDESVEVAVDASLKLTDEVIQVIADFHMMLEDRPLARLKSRA